MIISCLFLYENMHTLILGHGTLAIFGVKNGVYLYDKLSYVPKKK